MWATSSAAHSTAALVIVLVAIVLGSAATGWIAQAVGSLIENLWLARRLAHLARSAAPPR